jgi:DNA-binding GntR family transcriptional regulator
VETIFDGHPPLARSASAAAAELIREAIVDGRVSPGHRLKEEELAQQLGISRTPVREALLLLQAEGLVEAVPNRGSAVRAYDRRELEELYELRALLEGHAASRAATHRTDAHLDELRQSCARFAALLPAAHVPSLVGENNAFHETILDAAASERLKGMVRQVVAMPLVYSSYHWYSPDECAASHETHLRLVDAFQRRDALRAETVMRAHVLAARDLLVQHVGDAAGVEVRT